jgi:hypothetical protein
MKKLNFFLCFKYFIKLPFTSYTILLILTFLTFFWALLAFLEKYVYDFLIEAISTLTVF